MSYDPIAQMELDNKRIVVEHDKLKDKARALIDKAVHKALPGGLKKAQVRPLVFYPNDQLTQVCDPIPEIAIKTKLMRAVADDMMFTMYLCGGIGLAGPQIAYMKRIFVCDWSEDRQHPVTCINPEILSVSKEMESEREACLSVPGSRVPVVRAKTIEARWYNERGKVMEMTLEGWAARIFQHEHDHLDGKMMLDLTNRLERRLAIKKMSRIGRGELKPGPKPKRKKKKRR